MSEYDLPEDDVSTYSRTAILISAVVGIVVTVFLAWVAAGFDVFHEELFRVGPTVEDGGVGADWVAGNTIPALDFLIALVHAADVIMGVFILFMVFLHWASFRRLAARMRQPGETVEGEGEGVAADGGKRSDGPRSSSDVRSDGGVSQPEGGETE